MGCIGLFCCFKDMRPNVIALVGLVTNFIAFVFLIWALADLPWFRNGPKALYIISFILITLCLICFIIILILLNLRTGLNYITYNNVGKILCLAIAVMSILSFILLLIGGILQLVDMADIKGLPSHDWAALFVPTIFGLIATIIMALCANILYKIFNDNILTTITYQQHAIQNIIVQNSTATIPNSTQNVVITGNNAGTLPPVVVTTQQ